MPRPNVAAYRLPSGPSITWLTTVIGRVERVQLGVPERSPASVVSTMPRSVPSRTRPFAVISRLSAGTSGSVAPLTSLHFAVVPLTVTFQTWPAPDRSAPGPSVHVRLYPPNATNAVFGSLGSGVTPVIIRFGTAVGIGSWR